MIVSTTLISKGSAGVVGDAIRSVLPVVDLCVLIDTNGDDEALHAAMRAAGERAVPRAWPWRGDAGAARNAAIDFAVELGATWAVTLDVDERIEPRGEDMRGTLLGSTVGCVSAMAADESYGKPRAIRLPSPVRWHGRTHEGYAAHEDPRGQTTFASVRFSELHKTPAQLRARFARDALMLRAEIERNPGDGRWWYYLGVSLHGLGENDAAIAAWCTCARVSLWPEEAAWSCYQAASLLCAAERYDECIDACSAGLARHAGIAELCWLAGVASFRAGRYEQAIHWARLAEVHGEHGDRRALNARIGFRDAHALGPGPADVLRHALAACQR